MDLFQNLRSWNAKFDIWSLLSDFFFVFGVLFFDWNPVLLILWFMLDTASMAVFALILFFKEKNDEIDKIGFTIVVFMMIAFMPGLYSGVIKFIDGMDMIEITNPDPFQIFNPVILPIILCCCTLSHYEEFRVELKRKEKGVYNSSFIKHFFLRYLLINLLILCMVFSFYQFQNGILVTLLFIKSFLRVWNKKYREIL